MVGYSRVMLTTSEGKQNLLGADQLRKELLAEKLFIEGKEVRLVVDRKAKPEWVALYLSELSTFAPSGVKIATETRTEYPKEVPVLLPSQGRGLESCTLVGTITSDRATAIWQLKGGTARKRARGMGGPDLTMTGDTILSLKKTCTSSDVFAVHGAEGVEWGLIYDLGASGIALPKSDLRTLYIPLERPTPGQPVKL